MYSNIETQQQVHLLQYVIALRTGRLCSLYATASYYHAITLHMHSLQEQTTQSGHHRIFSMSSGLGDDSG